MGGWHENAFPRFQSGEPDTRRDHRGYVWKFTPAFA